MSTWFTADHHFGHRMIIKYERRHENIAGLTPDDMDIKIMDEFMIKQWNTFIQPDDVVYHLGDFALGPRPYKSSILQRLNGYKIIIIGNHDTGCKSMRDLGFDEAHRYLGLEIETHADLQRWLLVHTAYPYFGTQYWYDNIVCGHVHSAWSSKENAINVGVDVWSYEPIRIDTLARRFGCIVGSDTCARTIHTPKTTGPSARNEIKGLL